jgi:hypothetical protein
MNKTPWASRYYFAQHSESDAKRAIDANRWREDQADAR